jgi:hypothetical protein
LNFEFAFAFPRAFVYVFSASKKKAGNSNFRLIMRIII